MTAAFQTHRCDYCGGLVLVGMEREHDCPGRAIRRPIIYPTEGTS